MAKVGQSGHSTALKLERNKLRIIIGIMTSVGYVEHICQCPRLEKLRLRWLGTQFYDIPDCSLGIFIGFITGIR